MSEAIEALKRWTEELRRFLPRDGLCAACGFDGMLTAEGLCLGCVAREEQARDEKTA